MDYSAVPRDTTLDAFRVQIEVLRRLGVEGRSRMTFQLCDQVRQLAAAGVRSRHPEYTDEQIRLAVIRLRLGDRLFSQVYPGIAVEP